MTLVEEPSDAPLPSGRPPTSRAGSAREQGWRGLVTVVLLIGVAPVLLGLAWLISDAAGSDLAGDAPTPPIGVVVQEGSEGQSVPAVAGVEGAASDVVRSPRSGTVTNSRLATGAVVAPGDVALWIDDRPVLAFFASAPLWRDLHRGDRGEDVRRAAEFLALAGFLKGAPGDRADADFMAAVAAMAKTRHLASSQALLRDDLVWLGASGSTLKAVAVKIGDPVVRAKALATSTPRSRGVAFDVLGTPPARLDTLTVGSTTVDLTPSEVAARRVTSEESVQAIRAELAANPQAVMSVGSRSGRRVGVVPATAVVTDATGKQCVFADATGQPIMVEVSAGGLSAANVSAELIGRTVLANPREVRTDLSCG